MNVPDTITASAGSFDLRDYEVARGQFFSSVGRISVSFSYKQISFNKDAIRKFPNIKICRTANYTQAQNYLLSDHVPLKQKIKCSGHVSKMVNLFQNQFPALHFCQHYTRYLNGTKNANIEY